MWGWKAWKHFYWYIHWKWKSIIAWHDMTFILRHGLLNSHEGLTRHQAKVIEHVSHLEFIAFIILKYVHDTVRDWVHHVMIYISGAWKELKSIDRIHIVFSLPFMLLLCYADTGSFFLAHCFPNSSLYVFIIWVGGSRITDFGILIQFKDNSKSQAFEKLQNHETTEGLNIEDTYKKIASYYLHICDITEKR